MTIQTFYVENLVARSLAHIVHAAARIRTVLLQPLAFVCVALARAAERRLGEFSRAQLANAAWAFAKAARRDAALSVVLTRAAAQRMGEVSALDGANTAWAFATAAQWDAGFCVALARAAERRLGEFSP